jgi:antitoxin ParD1/3/4
MPEKADFPLEVSLSPSERSFVESEAARTGCREAAEYVRHLIDEARRHAARAEVERKLIEGLDSGPPIEVTPEYSKGLREELLERLRRKRA